MSKRGGDNRGCTAASHQPLKHQPFKYAFKRMFNEFYWFIAVQFEFSLSWLKFMGRNKPPHFSSFWMFGTQCFERFADLQFLYTPFFNIFKHKSSFNMCRVFWVWCVAYSMDMKVVNELKSNEFVCFFSISLSGRIAPFINHRIY